MRKVLVLMLLVASVIALAVSAAFFKIGSPDVDLHNSNLNKIRLFYQTNVRILESLSEISSNATSDFDELSHLTLALRGRFQAMSDVRDGLGSLNSEEIANLLREVDNVMAAREIAIEYFKRDSAILKNSLDFFPRIYKEVDAEAVTSELHHHFDELGHYVMFYVMNGAAEWYQKSMMEISILSTMLRDQDIANTPAGVLLVNFLAHSELIVEGKHRQIQFSVVQKTRQLDGLIDSVHKAYMAYYTARTAQANVYRYGMLSASFVLILITAYTLILLGRNARDLAIEKEKALSASHSKSAFLANMSHEIRTPLTAIIGFGEATLESGQTMEERLSAIRAIVRNGRHLLAVINEILDFSKIESGKIEFEKVSVNLLDVLNDIESIMQLQAEHKALDFVVEFDTPVPAIIYTDPVRLKQILLNLCINAIKFTAKGKVQLRLSCVTQDKQLKLSVIDSGIGLTDEQIEKLFEPFTQADTSTTRKFGGTGLGLFISQRLAQGLGGDIHVTSVPNEGSQFDVLIDTGDLADVEFVEVPKRENGEETESRAMMPSLNGTVLLAEDNSDNQGLISFYIEKTGASVEIAGNGKLALERAKEEVFDLILMDMQMPIMDGVEATHQLRQSGYSKPIVALTANAFKEDVDTCMSAGCDNFLSKPIDLDRFYEVLQAYLPAQDTVDAGTITPLSSQLVDSEPQLKALVMKFINSLPETQAQIQAEYAAKEWQALEKSLHNVKGMGGGFGYPQLTSLAARIEFEVKKGDYNEVEASLKELATVISCIIAGKPE